MKISDRLSHIIVFVILLIMIQIGTSEEETIDCDTKNSDRCNGSRKVDFGVTPTSEFEINFTCPVQYNTRDANL